MNLGGKIILFKHFREKITFRIKFTTRDKYIFTCYNITNIEKKSITHFFFNTPSYLYLHSSAKLKKIFLTINTRIILRINFSLKFLQCSGFILIIVVPSLVGLLLLTCCCCIYCKCCRSKSLHWKKVEEKMTQRRKERQQKADEKKSERKKKTDAMRMKYGLLKDDDDDEAPLV